MSAVRVYKSTDASAPTLSGTAGDLITVLNACLVTGYGTQPAAGWTKSFDTATHAVYRGGSGVRHFYHVDDNSPNVTAAAREAQFRGSETATAFQTGTNFFPTTAQIALGAGLVIRKSTAASGVTRPWIVVADDRTVYIFVQTGDVASTYYGAMFGEFYSLLQGGGDLYRSHVIGRPTANSGTNTTSTELMPVLTIGSASGGLTGHFIARPYTAIGTSTISRKWGDSSRATPGGNYNIGTAGLQFPEPVTNVIHVAPVHVDETSATVRGRMRGLFQPCHNLAQAVGITDGQTVAGTGLYQGKTFLTVFSPGGSGSVYYFDITGPWETN